MLRTIYLHGWLGERFGKEHRYDVASAGEAIRAIEANHPGFMKCIAEESDKGVEWRVQFGERDIDDITELSGPLGAKTSLHITPVIGGAADSGGVIKTIVGAILIIIACVVTYGAAGAALTAGTTTWGAAMGATTVMGVSMSTVALVGAGLMLSGISNLLTPTPKSDGTGDSGENKASYMFNGPVNTVAQGGPVPIGYGEMIIGSYTISASLAVKDIPIGVAYG